MRKVYDQEKSGTALALAVFFSVGFTAMLFGFIPFAHRVNKPQSTLELVRTTAVDLPPSPEEEEAPPQVEEETPREIAPEPQLAEPPQDIPLSAALDEALGSGGALAGFGADIRALAVAEPVDDGVFDVTELERPPEVVSQVDPSYPPELRKARIEGKVTILFVLDETGRVEDPRVENSSRPEFEKPALEAVRRWRFRPGMRDGQAVRTFMKVPIGFRVRAG
jgi:protein TonB